MNPLIPSRTLARLAGLALLLASSACRSDAPQVPSASGGSAPLLARIEAERGDAACDTDAQCHTIGVGHKACGGPERYLAWSSKNSDGSRLRALVAEHAAARSAEDTKKGMMSTCSVVPDPGATCAAGHCVLRAAGAGPGGMAPVAR
ncbi:hypothetical protein [Massilia luteola]|uniref:hypothetical protein n=1 Tax=Massilia luteola TaxID=3081751 RepID=UPI002ACC3128|nr:hypothetical protein [Massilia sp. Gc5]